MGLSNVPVPVAIMGLLYIKKGQSAPSVDAIPAIFS